MNTLKKIFINKVALGITTLLVLAISLAVCLWFFELRVTFYNYLYNALLATLAMIGGIMGFIRMRQWGGFRTQMGKISLFMGTGLLMWSFGSWVWFYYTIFLNTEIPYPSAADFLYIMIYPFWGAGLYFLVTTTAVKDQRGVLEKLYLLCIPALMFIVTFYFVVLDLHGSITNQNELLKLITDVAYPMSDIVLYTILILFTGTTLNYLGARFKQSIALFMLGLLTLYVADFLFSYTTTVGTYYNGCLPDLFFALTMTMLSLGVNALHPDLLKDN